MNEETTLAALECLKLDLQRHTLKEERFRLKEESNKLMMETVKELIPMLPQLIAALSEGEFSSETLEEITKRMPGFAVKLSVSDFLTFAKTIDMMTLESLIADLQKMLDDRGVPI